MSDVWLSWMLWSYNAIRLAQIGEHLWIGIKNFWTLSIQYLYSYFNEETESPWPSRYDLQYESVWDDHVFEIFQQTVSFSWLTSWGRIHTAIHPVVPQFPDAFLGTHGRATISRSILGPSRTFAWLDQRDESWWVKVLRRDHSNFASFRSLENRWCWETMTGTFPGH